jgi:hypothetical protein
MIPWRFFKPFPKYAIALTLFFGSSALFVIWWLARSPVQQSLPVQQAIVAAEHALDAKRQEVAEKAASLPERLGWLVLVGNDLYDISTGELIFKDFLEGMPPKRLFYQKSTNRLMAQYERGIYRFKADGTRDGFLGEGAAPAFTHDGKMAMFVKDGDVHIAEVNWREFAFSNPRQVTRIGKFTPEHFAANTVIGSENALVVRNQPGVFRIDLRTGDIRQIRLLLDGMVKRRSPDGRMLIGDARNIYVYDVEAEDAYNFPESRWRAVDFQRLSNDACAFIVASRSVSVYDRKKNTIEEICQLPVECSQLVGPSPDGRYVLCIGRKGIVIVDMKEKRAEDFGTPAHNLAWVGPDTMFYSRNVPDCTIRGTWLRKVGEQEKLVMSEPYHFGRGESLAVDALSEIGVVVFTTRDALFRMNSDGTELKEVAKLRKPAESVLAVKTWGDEKPLRRKRRRRRQDPRVGWAGTFTINRSYLDYSKKPHTSIRLMG